MADIIEINPQINRWQRSMDRYAIPQNTQGALLRYLEHRIDPGGFLTSVLVNDLFSAIARADPDNQRALPEICKFVYNEIPQIAWGSYANVAAWLDQRS